MANPAIRKRKARTNHTRSGYFPSAEEALRRNSPQHATWENERTHGIVGAFVACDDSHWW